MKKTLILILLALFLFFLGNRSAKEASRWVYRWVFGLEGGEKYLIYLFFSSTCHVIVIAIVLYMAFKIVEWLC